MYKKNHQLKICVFGLIMFLSIMAVAQNEVEVQQPDSVKRNYDPHYFYNTFFLSQSFSDEFVGIKKNKYTLAPDAEVADIIEKMPTVHIIDGQYYVQGQRADYMLLNGYTMFSSNNTALNNFPEGFVGDIHIIEDPSLSMSFANIMDDDVCRVIDIIPDEQYTKNSWFGRFYGGWGMEDKWNGGAILNYFDGNRKLSFTAQGNNINRQTYSPLDLSGMLNANTSSRFSIASTHQQTIADHIDYYDINQLNGINRDFSTGIRYLDTYKNIKYYFNYFYTSTDNQTDASLDYFYHTDKNRQYSEQSNMNSLNNTHRINGKFYYYIGDNTLLRIAPTVLLQNLTGKTDMEARQTPHQSIFFLENNTFDGSRTNVNIDFIHDFKKKGRNLLINCNPQYSANQNKYDNLSQSLNIFNDTLLVNNKIITDGYRITADISYTEPVGSKGLLQFSYLYGYGNDRFKKQSEYSDTDIFYAGIIDSASMQHYETENQFISHAFGCVYQFDAEKWRLNFGCRALLTYVTQTGIVTHHTSTKNIAIYPAPSFNYHYYINRFSTFKIGFKSYTTAPGLLNMQETPILQGPLNATYGNRHLKYSWNNVLNIRYTRLNRNFSDYFFASVNTVYSNNYTANNLISEYDKFYNPDVVQSFISVVSPENMNAYLNITPYLHYTLPLARIKSLFDVDIFGQYAHVPTQMDEQKGFSNQFQTGTGLALKSGIGKCVDFLLSSYSTYNYNVATWDNENFTQYVYQRSRLKVTVLPWKQRILLQTDLSHNYIWEQYSAYKEIDNNDAFFLWNASVGYKFLKDRSLTLKGSVHDILNQNKNIYQYTTSIYSESIKTNDLKRYFMVSLVYDLNKFGNP